MNLTAILDLFAIALFLSATLPGVTGTHVTCNWVPGGTGDPVALGYRRWCTAVKNDKDNRYYCQNCPNRKRDEDPEVCYGDMVADYGYLAPRTLEFREFKEGRGEEVNGGRDILNDALRSIQVHPAATEAMPSTACCDSVAAFTGWCAMECGEINTPSVTD